MQFIEGNVKTYVAGATALAAYVLVETESGVVVTTASSTSYIGATVADAAASTIVGVKGWNASGTTLVLASGTVTTGDPLKFAADGKVATWTAGSYLVGWARTGNTTGLPVECQLCAAFMPATDAGLSRDVGTCTFSSVVATDELVITPTGGSPITLTAVASGATPTELQFCVGASTNAAGDITAAGNLATAINASATCIAAGITAATPTTAAVTIYAATRMELTPSSGDGAKVVCANHTNESQFGELKDRLGWLMSQNEDRDTEITALEALDQLSLVAAAGNIAANTIVTPTLDTTCKFGYASTSVLQPLYVSTLGATAGAACAGTGWLTRATHTVQSTAAAIVIGDLVYLAASGVVAQIAAGAGKVIVGTAVTAVGAGGGTLTVAPCAPYLTLA